MDKLRAFFGQLKRHHFWVLAGTAILLTFTGWYLAASDLAQQYQTNKSKIEAEFSELSAIVSKTNHENETFEAGTKVLTANLKKDVQKAWTLVYADQKSKVLKWPKELGEEFLEWIDDPANYTAKIPVEYREYYLNYIKEEFPRLLQIVDARPYWDRGEDEPAGGLNRRRGPAMEGVGPGGRPRPVQPEHDYKVIWDKKSQQPIDESLDFPQDDPDSQAVRFCQENLWVYHALLDAIADVNQGATGHHNAKIKEIIALNIGQDASELVKESLTPGRIVSASGATNTPGMPAMPMGMEGGMGGPMGPPRGMEGMEGGGGPGMMPGGPGGGRKLLDDKRYVDEKGIPMPSGTTGPTEFKRMPILMRLFMDQREIAKLLVRLADSPLPVEIRQLRINTKMQGFNSQRMSLFGAGRDAGGGLGLRGGPGLMRRDRAFEEASQNPHDLALELHGIIYIFNPPDQTLTVTEVAEGDAAPLPAELPAAAVSGDAEAKPAEETPVTAPAEGDVPEAVDPAAEKPASAKAAEEELGETEGAAPAAKSAPKKASDKAEEEPFGQE